MRAYIFDLDGTLIESAPDLMHAANLMLSEMDTPGLTLTQIKSFIGNGTPKLVERVLTASGLPHDGKAHATAHARFMEIYLADPTGHTTVFDGVHPVLEELAALGHPLAVCTNKPVAPTRSVLQTFDLARFFPVVIGGDSLAVIKPDPAPLRAAMQGLGTDDAVFIGDSEVDAATAAALPLPFGLFTEGYRKSPVEDLPHDFAFADFAALPGLLAQVR